MATFVTASRSSDQGEGNYLNSHDKGIMRGFLSRGSFSMKAQARHILVKTAEEAEQLKQRIAKGEAFDVLAKKYSTCPSGKRGGDLGEVRPGQMVGAIDQIIFKKPLRTVHGPVKSKFGYHLVQVFYRD
jgi:peptidyl-prolyl cis-trans isomerase C